MPDPIRRSYPCISGRLIHCNVTAHPSAAWTLQQLREAIGLQDRYEYLLHDRDSIFASHLDESIGRLGVKVLKSWIPHYNTGRPHMALGPGVPDPPPGMQINPRSRSRHRFCEEVAVRANSVLGGLHHEYFW